MQVVSTIPEVRVHVAQVRQSGQDIGLVPTMGALHEGHLSLIQAARAVCDYVVVTIFVNPTQFGPQEDLDAYPRPLEQDLEVCRRAGVDLVFTPSPADMYSPEACTWVTVERLTDTLCGEKRPGHFRGVTTVCCKFFNIVQADQAFFGQKDAQQVTVIRRMVTDLNLPLKIVVCPTLREADGLALSSRNRYLTADERAEAVVLYQALGACMQAFTQGERGVSVLERILSERLQQAAHLTVDYANIVDAETLEPIEEVTTRALVAVAAYLGRARLIDNIVLDVAE